MPSNGFLSSPNAVPNMLSQVASTGPVRFSTRRFPQSDPSGRTGGGHGRWPPLPVRYIPSKEPRKSAGESDHADGRRKLRTAEAAYRGDPSARNSGGSGKRVQIRVEIGGRSTIQN